MARYKDAPYYVRSKDGRAILDYSTPTGRDRKALNMPYAGPERASPAERAAVERAGEALYRRLTDGRVIIENDRVRTTLKLEEAYAQFVEPHEPKDDDDTNTREKKRKKFVNLNAYGAMMGRWAYDDAKRPDGTPRWKGDPRTPFQRLVADTGPHDFLAWRLTKVVRSTMRKEKSNLDAFLQWCKTEGYLATLPPVVLPKGSGTKSPRAKNSGRGKHVPLTVEEALRIVAVMPEWSPGRPGPKASGKRRHISTEAQIELDRPSKERFRVRAFFEFMALTGLRPVTISRFEMGRNWSKGRTTITIENEDDKALYGRSFPLPGLAVELLERIAPAFGHIFGHHDRRKYVKAAAAIVLDPHRAKLFGSYHFRHFIGTLLAQRTTNVAAGMYVMGHTVPETFAAYVHPDEQGARELLAATEPEFRAAKEQAAAWVAEKLRAGHHPADSVPILSRQDGALCNSSLISSRGEWIRTTDPQTPSRGKKSKPAEVSDSHVSRNVKKTAKDRMSRQDSVPILSRDANEEAVLVEAIASANRDGDREAVRVLSRRLAAMTRDRDPASGPPSLRALKGGKS